LVYLFLQRWYRIGVVEYVFVGVVGGLPCGIGDSDGSLQGDAAEVVEIDGMDEIMVNDGRHFLAGTVQTRLQLK
jgi:hypothetical protein